jgi:hypothetical protein
MSETTDISTIHVRAECLRPAEQWERPTGDEIREVMRLTGFTGGEAAKALGLVGKDAGRSVRRWIGEESDIPYAVWALLCDFAGLGQIWKQH